MNPKSLFFEIHSGLPQEGPGSDKSTRHALHLIGSLPSDPLVLDIGCGPGRQTLVLAQELCGEIHSVDIHQPFLNELMDQVRKTRVQSIVKTHNASMDCLPFAKSTFDLIWSEGAAYVIGLEAALRHWTPVLKPGGFLVISELSWLKDPGKNEAWEFWQVAYPSMKSIEANSAIMERIGYKVQKQFVLPKEDWFVGYYAPMEKRIANLRQKYAADKEALKFLAGAQREIDLFRVHSDSYGYVFYILKKQT